MAENIGYATLNVIPSARDFGKKLDSEVSGSLRDAGTKGGKGLMSGLGAPLAKIGGLVAGAVAGFAGIKTVIGGGIARQLQLEDATAKLEGLGHSTENVEKIMDNALKSVKGTAFGLGDAATVAASAVAAGVKPGQDLTRTLSLVGDAATIAGSDMGSMGAIFNKVAASNKVQMDVINQLHDQGVPALQLLADEMGVTAEEAQKMASAGEIDFARFQDAMEKGLGGAAQKSGETTRGAFANMRAALGRLGETFTGPAFKAAKDFFNLVTVSVDVLNDLVSPAFDLLADTVGASLSESLVTAQGNVESFGLALQGFGKILGSGEFDRDFFKDLGLEEDSGIVNFLFTVRGAVGGLFQLIANGDYRGDLLREIGLEEDSALVSFIFNVRDGLGGLFQLIANGDYRGDLLGRLGIEEDDARVAFILDIRDGLKGLFDLVATGDFQGDLLRRIGIEEDSAVVDFVLSLRDGIANLASAIGAGDWGAVGDQLVAGLEGLGNLRNDLFTSIAAALPGMLDAFVGFLPQLTGFLTGTLLPAVLDQLTSITDAIVEVVATVLPALVESLAVAAPILVGALLGVLSTLIEAGAAALPQIVEALTSALPQIVETLALMAPVLLEAGLTLFMQLAQAVLTALPLVLESLLGILPQLLSTLMSMLPSLLTAGIEMFKQLVFAVLAVLPELLDTLLGDVLPSLVDTVLGMLPDLLTAGIDLFFALVEAVLVVLPKILTTLLTRVLPRLVTTLIQMLPRLVTAAIQLFSGLIQGLLENLPELVNTIIFDVIPAVLVALAEAVPDLVQAGVDLLLGLVDGLWSMASAVGQALLDIIGSAVDGFLGFLGIHSPSRLFKSYGVNVGEGFIGGIDSMGSAVGRSIDGMAGTAADAALSALDRVERGANGRSVSWDVSAATGSIPDGGLVGATTDVAAALSGGAAAPLVGQLSLVSSGDTKEDLETVAFHLRTIHRGGRVAA